MQRLDRIDRLVYELHDERPVIDRVVLIHCALDRHAVLVDDDDAEDAHVRVDAIQRFFHFLRRCHLFALLV